MRFIQKLGEEDFQIRVISQFFTATIENNEVEDVLFRMNEHFNPIYTCK